MARGFFLRGDQAPPFHQMMGDERLLFAEGRRTLSLALPVKRVTGDERRGRQGIQVMIYVRYRIQQAPGATGDWSADGVKFG
jgi:hypothetical protein